MVCSNVKTNGKLIVNRYLRANKKRPRVHCTLVFVVNTVHVDNSGKSSSMETFGTNFRTQSSNGELKRLDLILCYVGSQ